MLIEGVVELRIPVGVGKPNIIRRVEAKGHFGERVLLGGGLRTGTTVAIENTKVLVCHAEDFKRITKALLVLDEYFKTYLSSAYAETNAK